MFWLAVVGGGLIFLHILMLVFLRWRTKTSLRGALSVPRFELFVLVLALPAICQASAFTIRGKSLCKSRPLMLCRCIDLQMPVRLCVRNCVSRWISAVCPVCTNGGVVFSYNEGQTL